MFLHILERPLGIRNHIRMPLAAKDEAGMEGNLRRAGHAIGEDKGRNPFGTQPFGHQFAFILFVVPVITSAGTNDNADPVGLLRFVRIQGYFLAKTDVLSFPKGDGVNRRD